MARPAPAPSSHLPSKEELFCPVNATLDLLNQRWNLRIVRTLLAGKKRFNEISRENGINPRTLRDRLRDLEEEGIIHRELISDMPQNMEHRLSEEDTAVH